VSRPLSRDEAVEMTGLLIAFVRSAPAFGGKPAPSFLIDAADPHFVMRRANDDGSSSGEKFYVAGAARSKRDLEPARVLVLEDDVLVARAVCKMLARAGYTVIGPSATADDALAASRAHAPDLVVADIWIRGGADGISAARAICAERPVPVLFMTASLDTPTMQRALESSDFGILAKPFLYAQLSDAVQTALGDRERSEA
jgi:CheY-like chemotaxis protein